MAKKVYEEAYIANIAEKIRDKTGGDTTYKTREMPSGIDEVYEAGKEVIIKEITPINSELEQTLYGLDTGGKSFYDEFWDEYQYSVNGVSQRTGCAYMFAYSGWNDKTFKPKYSMSYISNANNMFNTCGVTDIKDILEKQGIVFDFSKATTFNQAFAYSKITRLPNIDSRGAIALSSAFYQSTALEEVHIILKDDGTQTFSNTFYNCKSLSKLTFEGVIGKEIDLSACPLSKESLINIIGVLSTITTGLPITLSKTAVDNAFAADEWSALIGTRSNWTISLI